MNAIISTGSPSPRNGHVEIIERAESAGIYGEDVPNHLYKCRDQFGFDVFAFGDELTLTGEPY